MTIGWNGASVRQWLAGWPRLPFGLAARRRRTDKLRGRGARAPASASDAFSPTRAQNSSRRIIGRKAEVDQIVSALLEDHAHVVLFSERGRGKTSLTNFAVEVLRQHGAVVARMTCDAGDEFDSMIRGLARDLPSSMLPAALRRSNGEGCEPLLPQRPLSASDVASFAGQLSAGPVVFVVDEFDRTADLATRTRIADTIKLLSDRNIDLHFVLVAVSVTLEEILGEHPSVQRNLLALHLPLLAETDVRTMLVRGAEQADIVFTEAAIELVVAVARGMPYMAQLLGLRIAQATLRRDGRIVSQDDLEQAVQRVLQETPSSVKAIYAALTDVPHEDMANVLRHVASAEQDALGAMALHATDDHVGVGGVQLTRNAFSLLSASGVLAQSLGEIGTVHVNDRPLMYHVLLLAARDWLAECGAQLAERT